MFLEKIFKVPAFQEAYVAGLKEFSQGIFRPERLAWQVDELARAIQPAIEDESPEKLERFTQVVAGKTVEMAPFGGGPGGPRRGGFGGQGPMFQAPKPIKPFVAIRARSIQDQLDGKSKGMEVGGFGPGGGPPRGGPGRNPELVNFRCVRIGGVVDPDLPQRAANKVLNPEIHILGDDPLWLTDVGRRRGSHDGIKFAIVGVPSRGITQDLMGGVQFLGACHRLGRSVIEIRMKVLGQQPVRSANLPESAVAVEAERGVMIGFSALQSPILPCEISVASFNAASNCIWH